jgi:hypothetical protein
MQTLGEPNTAYHPSPSVSSSMFTHARSAALHCQADRETQTVPFTFIQVTFRKEITGPAEASPGTYPSCKEDILAPGGSTKAASPTLPALPPSLTIVRWGEADSLAGVAGLCIVCDACI